MNAAEETIYQSGAVTITTARFVVGPRTFPIRAISSIEAVHVPAPFGGAIILIMIALLVGLMAYSEGMEASGILIGTIGAFIFGMGVVLLTVSKEKFQIVLHTSGGQVMAFESKAWEDIEIITTSLNAALALCG